MLPKVQAELGYCLYFFYVVFISAPTPVQELSKRQLYTNYSSFLITLSISTNDLPFVSGRQLITKINDSTFKAAKA